MFGLFRSCHVCHLSQLFQLNMQLCNVGSNRSKWLAQLLSAETVLSAQAQLWKKAVRYFCVSHKALSLLYHVLQAPAGTVEIFASCASHMSNAKSFRVVVMSPTQGEFVLHGFQSALAV